VGAFQERENSDFKPGGSALVGKESHQPWVNAGQSGFVIRVNATIPGGETKTARRRNEPANWRPTLCIIGRNFWEHDLAISDP
jgi:hypothetical protein